MNKKVTEAKKVVQSLRDVVLVNRTVTIWVENHVIQKARAAQRRAERQFRRLVVPASSLVVLKITNEMTQEVSFQLLNALMEVSRYVVRDVRGAILQYRKESSEEDDLSGKIAQGVVGRSSYWKNLIAKHTAKTRSVIAEIIRIGIEEGKSMAEMAAEVAAALKTDLYLAERIIRTEVMAVSNMSLQETYASMPDVVKGIQYLATLDNRTCPQCGPHDFEEYFYEPTGDQYSVADAPALPLHCNCRCVYAPVALTWAELGQPTVGPEVPYERQSYSDWLADQPVETQKMILGKYFGDYKGGDLSAVKKSLTQTFPPEKLGASWISRWRSR